MGNFLKRFILYIVVLGVFGKFIFFPFCDQYLIVPHGFHNFKNKGGGPSYPLKKISMTNPLFLSYGFPKGTSSPQPAGLSLLQGGCRERSSSGDHLLGREACHLLGREACLLGRGARGQGGRRASLSEHGGQTKGDHIM